MNNRAITLISRKSPTSHDDIMEPPRNEMQASRRQGELSFSHSMDADELTIHLNRLVIQGDCHLCEWFARSSYNHKNKQIL